MNWLKKLRVHLRHDLLYRSDALRSLLHCCSAGTVDSAATRCSDRASAVGCDRDRDGEGVGRGGER